MPWTLNTPDVIRVVFVMAEHPLHNRIVSDYVAARPGDEVAIIKVPLVLKGKGRLESAERIVPQLSRRFFAGKLIEFLVLIALVLLPRDRVRTPLIRRLRRVAGAHRLPYIECGNVMGEECLAFLRARTPDVIVTLSHQILRQSFLEIPRCGVVNLHPGVLPDFKGIQPYFWELSEGAARGGATLHLIDDDGIDTGRVLATTSFALSPGMSVQRNYYQTCLAASRALPACTIALVAGLLLPRAQDAQAGRYYRWPDSAAFDRLKERGHSLFSWRELRRLIRGEFDLLEAELHFELAPEAAVAG